jgi:hypothetical protein
MARDPFGNYVCDITPTTAMPFPASIFTKSGVGAPSNADGNNGDIYVNLINGDIYSKSGDTWTIATGGTGPAGGSGAAGSGSPEGVVTAAAGTTYVDANPPYDVWFKVSGSGNTGWIKKVE